MLRQQLQPKISVSPKQKTPKRESWSKESLHGSRELTFTCHCQITSPPASSSKHILLRLHAGTDSTVSGKWTELLCLCGYIRVLRTSAHSWKHTSPLPSIHARQIKLWIKSLHFSEWMNIASWAPTCLSISSPTARKDSAFLGSKQTVVLPTHNLHTNRKPDLVRKGHVFRTDSLKHYWQTNWAMNLYSAHQLRFWLFSANESALQATNSMITTQETAQLSLWEVMLQLFWDPEQGLVNRKPDSAVQHNNSKE